jgi:hypothetical protein
MPDIRHGAWRHAQRALRQRVFASAAKQSARDGHAAARLAVTDKKARVRLWLTANGHKTVTKRPSIHHAASLSVRTNPAHLVAAQPAGQSHIFLI